MSTNWKSLVESQNAKTFVLPEGWDSREKIAEQLGCSPERVREHLAPAIRARTVEMKQFIVWDNDTKAKVKMTAYRKLPQKPGKNP